jgi:predicted PurR-regulated permease PerM
MIIDDGTAREANRRHTLFLFGSAAIAVAIIIAAQSVLLPFVLALVIAYVLTPLVAWVERKRVPRAAAIILVYVAVLGTIGVFVRFTAPRVGMELVNLRRELPALGVTVRTRWVPAWQQRLRNAGFGPEAHGPDPVIEPANGSQRDRGDHDKDRNDKDRDHDGIPDDREPAGSIVARPRPDGAFGIELNGPLSVTPAKGGGYTIEPLRETHDTGFDLDRLVADAAGKSLLYAQHNALEIVKIGRDIIAGVSRFFFVFGITLMLAAYMMLTRERITSFFVSLVRPSSRASFYELLGRIDRGLSGVVRGQLIICLMNGVLSAIGFAIVGLKYWPVLALIATVLSLIPIFGSIISAIPAVALGLTQSVSTAVFVLVWILGVHQLEANVLNPKIMGDAAKIHPVLVVFSLLVGEHFFHTVGALLAVPSMSIAQSIFTHVRARVQAMDPEMAHEPVGSLRPDALASPPPAAFPSGDA